MQEDPSDYAAIQKRIWDCLESGDYAAGTREIEAVISLLESRFSTEYIDYIEYLFLLHQVYAEQKDLEHAIDALVKLLFHFQNAVDPRILSARGAELYIKTWTYLGYLLAEVGQKDASIAIFRKCLPVLMLTRGAESSEFETVKWYIRSVQRDGKISTDEPDPFDMQGEEEEGLRCSFCHTGQVDVIAGPSVYICRNCIKIYNNFLEDEVYCKHLRLLCLDSACSFQCNREPSTQASLFPGPGVFICGDCVRLCNDLEEGQSLPL